MMSLYSLFLVFSAALAGAGGKDAADRVDFVYFDGQSFGGIEVPFALSGQCAEVGVPLSASAAVEIEEVWADGRRRESFSDMRYADDALKITIRRPGAGFQYKMKLNRLARVDPDGHRLAQFPFDEKEMLPQRIVIGYRIRCADGKVGQRLETVGVKLGIPKSGECVVDTRGAGGRGQCK